MIDRWVHGRVAECQDGCPKFIQEAAVEVPGGAANAERCLSGWGVNTSLYGYSLKDCPIKTRYVKDGQIVFRADDDGSPVRVERYKWAHTMAAEMVQSASAVLLSDYDKGFLTPGFIREIVALCQTRGIPCVADCKRGPAVYTGCIRKCNEDYSKKWCGNMEPTFVVTRGERTPDVYAPNRLYRGDGDGRVDLPPVKCVNHVGAGDCFAAHLTLALACGFSLKEAAGLAHSAGRVYVQSPHNKPPHPAEIRADMDYTTE